MPEEKKQRLKEYQKNYYKTQKTLNIKTNKIVFFNCNFNCNSYKNKNVFL